MLGVSSGAACIATCAPVLIPCLLGEAKGVVGNVWITGQFLIGRLAGYLLFAVLAWIVGRVLLPEGGWHDLLIGTAYAGFSALLVGYGFFKKEETCERGCPNKFPYASGTGTASLPVIAGFVTGLAFCPPFLAAFAGAAGEPSLAGSLFFFIAFFAGTSIFFIPAPLVGFFRNFAPLRMIGRMAAGLMGLYFLYSGIILMTGGISRL